MSIMLIMSCYTGFFNVWRGWQSLNTGPRFYLRLIRRTGWLWIYASRTTDGCPFKPKKLSVPFLYPGVPEVLNQYWTFKNNERFFLSFYMHVCLYMCCACTCYLYNQCLQPILYLFFKMGWMNHVIKEGICDELTTCSIFKIHIVFCHLLCLPFERRETYCFSLIFFFRFFCFFSAKLVWTITFLSFQIGQLYLVCGCMTIRRCVAYCNDLRGTLIFDLKVK
jgi:hypothetical protein